MTSSPSPTSLKLKLAPLTAIWFIAFTDPAPRRLWPDTPGVRGWWDEANSNDLRENPFQKYVKVVGTEMGRIAAYAKWDLSTPEERGRRYPPWHADMPAADMILDTLATHPDYQRRGAGSMLLQWGCGLADEDSVALYVDASKAGASLYQRFGFVDESEPDAGEMASMARARRVR
ncbi:GNAT family N-acetyltransferase [Aspergillus undulatus]|uniref:GNAT family N-acetyltransferase n=1 Tax=Aspergillus undulatus TaxID=1810928 RepID=UPI003CCDF001